MEPTVSPWIFYWIDVSDKLVVIVAIMAAISMFVMFLYFIETEKFPPKKAIAFSVTCLLIMIFIPSQSTIYKMAIASCITPDNINMTVETAGKIADTISERVDRAADNLIDKIKKK